MKNKALLCFALIGVACFAATDANAAKAWQTDIPLGTPDGFSATSIAAVGDGRYCVSGSIADDADSSESALVLLVDTQARRTVWKTAIPRSPHSVSNAASRCASDGTDYYAVTQEHTHRSEALNQTQVVINKIAADGRLIRQQTIKAGFDEWSWMLDVRPDGVSVGGGTSATLDRGGPFSTFVARFDANLAPLKSTILDSGAYWSGSHTELAGTDLFVAGAFLPNVGKSAGRDAFAASKIHLGSGKYAWSTYPFPADTREVDLVRAADGAAYLSALTASALTVLVVDREGKTDRRFSVEKLLCGIDSLALDGHVLKAVGPSCKGAPAPVIVAIDTEEKTAAVVQRPGDDVSATQLDGGSWVGIVKTDERGDVFRQGATAR